MSCPLRDGTHGDDGRRRLRPRAAARGHRRPGPGSQARATCALCVSPAGSPGSCATHVVTNKNGTNTDPAEPADYNASDHGLGAHAAGGPVAPPGAQRRREALNGSDEGSAAAVRRPGVPEEASRIGTDLPEPPRDTAIGELARRQHGVITLGQLQLAGLTASAVRNRVRPAASTASTAASTRSATIASPGTGAPWLPCSPTGPGRSRATGRPRAPGPPRRQQPEDGHLLAGAVSPIAPRHPRPRHPHAPPPRRHETPRHPVHHRRPHAAGSRRCGSAPPARARPRAGRADCASSTSTTSTTCSPMPTAAVAPASCAICSGSSTTSRASPPTSSRTATSSCAANAGLPRPAVNQWLAVDDGPPIKADFVWTTPTTHRRDRRLGLPRHPPRVRERSAARPARSPGGLGDGALHSSSGAPGPGLGHRDHRRSARPLACRADGRRRSRRARTSPARRRPLRRAGRAQPDRGPLARRPAGRRGAARRGLPHRARRRGAGPPRRGHRDRPGAGKSTLLSALVARVARRRPNGRGAGGRSVLEAVRRLPARRPRPDRARPQGRRHPDPVDRGRRATRRARRRDARGRRRAGARVRRGGGRDRRRGSVGDRRRGGLRHGGGGGAAGLGRRAAVPEGRDHGGARRARGDQGRPGRRRQARASRSAPGAGGAGVERRAGRGRVVGAAARRASTSWRASWRRTAAGWIWRSAACARGASRR